MNLLKEPWLPVRLKNGNREWIAPDRLADPELVAFDADRPDFNGALMQFAIGLLQSTTAINSPMQWGTLFNQPPGQSDLAAWFEPVLPFFELDGDGPRFMQDLTLQAAEATENEIGALFIDSPGENALRNNSDHFIKRGRITGLCPHCAATALLALQINAPSGGQGHRTGLRGGGPLTTLVLCSPSRSLWHDLWLNVLERQKFLAESGTATLDEPVFRFPWVGAIEKIQAAGGETQPAQVHPDHVFWAMPRRIRLDFVQTGSGQCDICGRPAETLLSRYLTRNYGLNYKGQWNHVLSPYYENKGEWLPLHPQPGGLGYRHWLAWVLGYGSDKKNLRSARVIQHALGQRLRQMKQGLHLWAFGYDMDNMKARCWYESRLPMYHLADCDTDDFDLLKGEVACWIEAAEVVASYLRSAVKDAWFSADARGDLSAVDAAFWAQTEHDFYLQLQRLIDDIGQQHPREALVVCQQWLAVLQKTAKRLFDEDFVGAGQVEHAKPGRIAAAHRQLIKNLNGPKLMNTLGIPVPDKAKSGKKSP